MDFFRLVVVQEYLAAMYLTNQGHKTTPCLHLFTQTKNQQSLAQALGAENRIKTIQFCCGMSPKFCEYIFSTAIGCCVIEKSDRVRRCKCVLWGLTYKRNTNYGNVFMVWNIFIKIWYKKQGKRFSMKNIFPLTVLSQPLVILIHTERFFNHLSKSQDFKTAFSLMNRLYELHGSKIQQSYNPCNITNYNSSTNTELKFSLDQLSLVVK